MITLLFIGGIIAFAWFVTALMIDPGEPQENEIPALKASDPAPAAPPVTDTRVQPLPPTQPSRTEPAFYEHIGGQRGAAGPMVRHEGRSPYIVDLSDRDAHNG